MIDFPVIKYDITDAVIEQLKSEAEALVITDNKSYKEVVSLISKIRKVRGKVESHRKALKKDALEYGRQVDSIAKSIKEKLLPIEASLKAKKQAEDDRIAAIKAEKERRERERVEAIKAKIEALPPENPFALLASGPSVQELEQIQAELKATVLSEDEYQEFIFDAQKAKAGKLAFLEQAIKDCQAEEEAKRQAEEERRRLEEEARTRELKRQKAEEEAEAARRALEEERRKAEEERKAREELERRLAELEKAKELESVVEAKDLEPKTKAEDSKGKTILGSKEAEKIKGSDILLLSKRSAINYLSYILDVMLESRPQDLSSPANKIVAKIVTEVKDKISLALKELEAL